MQGRTGDMVDLVCFFFFSVEVMAKLRTEGQEAASHLEVRSQSIPRGGNSWCRGPEMGVELYI
jgi:hypothetical protein